MKKLLPLHYCETRQDALFLKQTLQESSNILVFIQRKENGFMLVADKNDYNIAKIIVKNKLSMLPKCACQSKC